MSIAVNGVTYPDIVGWNLGAGRDGIMSGNIRIEDKEYRLEIISEDIMEVLSAVAGRSANVGFFAENPIKTIDTIPSSYRTDALEVKLRLMALIEELDEKDAAKLRVFENYHSRRENEISRYHNAMKRIDENFHERLRELGA